MYSYSVNVGTQISLCKEGPMHSVLISCWIGNFLLFFSHFVIIHTTIGDLKYRIKFFLLLLLFCFKVGNTQKCSGVNSSSAVRNYSWWAWETIWDAGEQTRVATWKTNIPPPVCTITPDSNSLFLTLRIDFLEKKFIFDYFFLIFYGIVPSANYNSIFIC